MDKCDKQNSDGSDSTNNKPSKAKRNDVVGKEEKEKAKNLSETGEEHELNCHKGNFENYCNSEQDGGDQERSKNVDVPSTSSSSSVADKDNSSNDSTDEEESNGKKGQSTSPNRLNRRNQSPASPLCRRPLHGYRDSAPAVIEESGQKSRSETILAPEMKTPGSDTYIQIGIVFAIFMLLVAILIFYASSNGNQSGDVCQQFGTSSNLQVAATSFIGNASKDLHFLEAREASVTFMSQIKSLGRRPYKPSCILFSVTDEEKTKDAFTCLGKYLNCFLSGNREALAVYSSHHKAAVDDEMIAALDNHKVVTLHNIDELDLETAKLLYKFCDDNDDPRYPGSMVLLTMKSTTREKLTEDELEQRLAKVWSSRADELSPLLSRIANSILTFSNEGFETCSI